MQEYRADEVVGDPRLVTVMSPAMNNVIVVGRRIAELRLSHEESCILLHQVVEKLTTVVATEYFRERNFQEMMRQQELSK